MSLNRIVAVTAVALGMCSLAYAAGPVVPKIDPFFTGVTAIPVHNSCHQNLRTHGGSYPQHYHRQSDCAVILADDEDDYDDCHHSVLRHFLPGYGKVWHRHRGSNCHVELYEHDSGPTPGHGGCIQIGPAVICP
jgi:hypothetical protein